MQRRATHALALACALLPLVACSQRNQGQAIQALAQADSPLTWTVNRAQATHHLATSSSESRDAAPGYQFVVLDVSVRNRDAQPQVLSEGALIAMDESNVQTFDRPETLLSDDYLSLQVLEPSQRLQGKIAYEVPEHLPGVLFWSPGNGSKRILLNVAAASAPQRTFANADDAEPALTHDIVPSRVAPARVEPVRIEPILAKQAPASEPPPQQVATEPTAKVERPVVVATRSAPPQAVRLQANPAVSTARAPSRTFAPVPISAPLSRKVATVIVAPPQSVSVPTTAASPAAQAAPTQVDAEQARKLACQGLVSRDDPAEKDRSLGFFAESCRDYALPEHWRPTRAPRRSLIARASALLSRIVVAPRVVRISDCSALTSRADMLVCGDPGLSTMDHRLTQAVARASDQVDDPAALQRDQALWRGRVRNACDTADCLEQAYGRRIAQLDALAPMHP